jgi:hypothetical protein
MRSPPPEFAERFGGTTKRSSSQMRASRSSDSKEVIRNG